MWTCRKTNGIMEEWHLGGYLAHGFRIRGFGFWSQTHVLCTWNKILGIRKPNPWVWNSLQKKLNECDGLRKIFFHLIPYISNHWWPVTRDYWLIVWLWTTDCVNVDDWPCDHQWSIMWLSTTNHQVLIVDDWPLWLSVIGHPWPTMTDGRLLVIVSNYR